MKSDLALLKVDKIKFDSRVRHICLPEKEDEKDLYRQGTEAVISGEAGKIRYSHAPSSYEIHYVCLSVRPSVFRSVEKIYRNCSHLP